ncbi:hypothetical protein M758_2G222600 [Ceratodon purpureus]|nr:hypothetical protein M758_2G222600 [Ceratodon purpureus]
MLTLQSAAEADHSSSQYLHTIDSSLDFPFAVADTLKQMMRKLVLDMKANPEIRKLLPVIQKSVQVQQMRVSTHKTPQCHNLKEAVLPSWNTSRCTSLTGVTGHGYNVYQFRHAFKNRGGTEVKRAATCRHSI